MSVVISQSHNIKTKVCVLEEERRLQAMSHSQNTVCLLNSQWQLVLKQPLSYISSELCVCLSVLRGPLAHVTCEF